MKSWKTSNVTENDKSVKKKLLSNLYLLPRIGLIILTTDLTWKLFQIASFKSSDVAIIFREFYQDVLGKSGNFIFYTLWQP